MTARHVPTRFGRGPSWLSAVAMVVGIAACGGTAPSDARATTADAPSAPPSSAASDAFRTLPAADGPIDAGRYRVAASPWSLVDFTVTLPEGWALQYGHIFQKNADTGAELAVYPVVVDRIYADACLGSSGDEVPTGTFADELSAALVRQGGPRASVMPTRLGGYEGIRVDMAVKDGLDLGDCSFQDVGLQVWYSVPADKYFVLLADAEASVYILDVARGRQVFLTQIGGQASEDDRAELQAILDSIRIER